MRRRKNCDCPKIEFINDPSSTSNTFYAKECIMPIKNSIRCDSNVGCIQTVNSECIIYNGKDFPLMNITRGQNLNSTIEYLVNAINTASTQADWAETNPTSNSFIKNKPDLSIYYLNSNPAGYVTANDLTWPAISGKPNFSTVAYTGDYSDLLNIPTFATVAFTGDYNDLINIPVVTIPNLQQVLTAGNSAVSSMSLDGNISLNRTASVNISLSSSTSTSSASLYSSSSSSFFSANCTNSGTVAEIRANPTNSVIVLDTAQSSQYSAIQFVGLGTSIIHHENDLHFRTTIDGVNINTIFNDGRMSGSDAINSNEFITLNQASSLSTNIYNSDGTLTNSRIITGAGNDFTITGTNNLSIGGSSVNLINTDGGEVNISSIGTTIFSPTDINILSDGGNIILNAAGDISIISPTTFSFPTKGAQAVNSDEYVTLNQLNTYVPGTRTITINGNSQSLSSNRIWNIGTIYTANGNLSGARFINGNTFPLSFINLDQFNVTSSSATFSSPVSGGDAVAGNNFVTLSQLSAFGYGTVTSVGLTSSDITVGGTSPITGSGTFTLTLPNINSNIGTYNNVTVNAKGQVTAASNVQYVTASSVDTFTNKSGNISQWTNNVGYLTAETDPTAIKNQTSVQTANFNISGNGTIGGVTTTANLTSPINTDLIISSTSAQKISLNIGSNNLIYVTTDGVGIGNLIPNSIRASKLEVAGNIWSEDAFILGAAGASTPRSEYGLSGTNDAFVRMMNTGNLDLITSETTVIARVNGITENFEVMNQIKISGGTPGNGKVLMDSNGSGLAEWTTLDLNKVLSTGNTSTLTATVSEISADAGSGLGRDRVRITGSTTGQGYIRNEVDSGSGFGVAGTLNILANQINLTTGGGSVICDGDINSSVKVITPNLQISGGSPSIGDVWTATDTLGNGTWQSSSSASTGPIIWNLTAVNTGTGPHTIQSTDVIVRYQPTSSGYTTNLPPVATSVGRVLILRNQSASQTVTLSLTVQTLTGSTTTLPIQSSMTIISDGTNWIQLF